MTDDDRLRQRLAAADPARHGDADGPLVEPSTTEIRERIMATLEHTTPADPSDGATRPRRRPTRHMLAAAAAVVALAAGGAAGVVAVTGGSPSGRPDGPAALALEVPSSGVSGSCIPFEIRYLRDFPVAFAGTVSSIGGDGTVSLDVDRWYAGGSGDRVTIAAPEPNVAVSLDSVDFVDGQEYLVSANAGTVIGCGYSGPATAELEQAYAEAFSG